MGGAERFCFCGGMATTNDHLERCRARAEQVIGGPLRARIAELEAEPERAKRLAVGFVEVALATAVPAPEVARAVAAFDEERLRAVAECERLRAHSIQLNAIAYRLAESLGLARDGQPVHADVMALLDQVLDDRAGYQARAESAEDQLKAAQTELHTQSRARAEWYAHTNNYFWLPCPLCGEYFGGHEWLSGEDGSSIPKPEAPNSFIGICPACTRSGAGLRATAAAMTEEPR